MFSNRCLAEITHIQYVRLKDDIRQSAKDYYKPFIGMTLVIVSEPLKEYNRQTHPALCIYPFDKDKHVRVHDSVSRFLRFHDKFRYIHHTNNSIQAHARSFNVYMMYGKNVGTVAIPMELLMHVSNNAAGKNLLERL